MCMLTCNIDKCHLSANFLMLYGNLESTENKIKPRECFIVN